MEKAITRKNFEITETTTKFLHLFLMICCMVLMCSLQSFSANTQDQSKGYWYGDVDYFNSLLLPQACITNSASINDVFACTGTSGELAFSMAGLVFPTPGAPTAYQWQFSTVANVWNNVSNGGVNGYLNANGTTPDANFGRNLFITDNTGLNGTHYRAVITFPAGYCTTSLTTNSMTLFVFLPPTVNVVSAPDPICSGGTGTLTANATGPAGTTLVYEWQPGGETTPQITVPNVTAATPQYTVMVTEHILFNGRTETGCIAEATGGFNVLQAPFVACSITPGNTVCEGSNVTFTANATGNVTSYQWQFNNANIAGQTNSTLSLLAVTPASQGTYKAIVSNTCGSNFCTEDLIVNVKPTITLFTTPSECVPLPSAPKKSFTFSVTASGTAPFSYQWSKNGVDLPGKTNSSLTFLSNDPANDLGPYKVVVSNACGSDDESGTLVICPCTPPVIEPIPDQEICNGTTATFTVFAVGTQPFAYQWYNGGGAIGGATKNTYTTGTAGAYFVVVTNDPTNCSESQTSNVATLTVDPTLAITCGPTSVTTTAGASVLFSVNVTAGTLVSFQWKFNGIAIAGQTNSSYTRTILSTDNTKQVCVDVTSKCGNLGCCTTINIPVTCVGFATLTQGGWGTVAHGGNPGTLRNKYFSTVFPNGLEIGREPNFHLILTSSLAVQNYLPDGTGPKAYTKNYLNPTGKITVLSGQLTALKLNVYFGAAGYLGTNKNLGNLCFTSGVLAGKTVYQFLAMADEAIGGGSLGGLTLSQYNDIASAINEGYDEGANKIGNLLSCQCSLPGAPVKALKISTDNTDNTPEMTVYPNPTTGLIDVTIPPSANASDLMIYNINGQRVYNVKVTSTDNVKHIDMSNNDRGIYFIRLSGGQENKTIKLIVQ